MAVRVALGAGRLRLSRQALTEAMLLAAAACLLGVAIAYVGAGALVRIIADERVVGLPLRVELPAQPNLQVLLFTAAISVVTGILFGIAPAWTACTPAPPAALKGIGRAPETSRGPRNDHRGEGDDHERAGRLFLSGNSRTLQMPAFARHGSVTARRRGRRVGRGRRLNGGALYPTLSPVLTKSSESLQVSLPSWLTSMRCAVSRVRQGRASVARRRPA